jgi:mono/diheme cytochrome c family protein
MNTVGNAILGILFLLLALASTFLMYRLWGYPYDHEKLKSSAPPRLLLTHRLIGYAYAGLYVYFMVGMVPRLWSYEVEFPARTVAHFVLGMSIGVILLVKVSIVRFFKHLEATLIPFLGTGLLMCTVLLIGLSVPFAMREVYLHESTVGGAAFSPENLERLGRLIPKAGFPPDVELTVLTEVNSLKEGREILLDKCVQCHDLRTVLVKPRTPQNWVETVDRMAARAVFNPISDEEQWRVAAYLIAISPELQKSFGQKRSQEHTAEIVKANVAASFGATLWNFPATGIDLATAKGTFDDLCTQCHGLKNLERSPPTTREEVTELIERMMENGLEATETELQQVAFFIKETYTQ